MAAHSGPKIHTDNLLLALDGASNKFTGKNTNILADYPWTVGTGSATFFSQNGDGNSRLLDTNSFGATNVVWDVSNQDASSDADGGWNSSTFAVDQTKLYRFSVWVRRKTVGNGSFYLGVYGRNSSQTNFGVLNRSDGAVNTNPYFKASGWWGSANVWYLVVGHVWPVGSGTGAVHPESGIYNTVGEKVSTTGDFVWQSGTFYATHRSYLYYSTDITTNQQFWDPRVDVVSDSKIVAPTTKKLLTNVNARWNLVKKVSDTILSLRKTYLNTSTNSFVFGSDDNDKSISVPLSGNFNKTEGTITCWIKPYGYSGSNGIFVNRSDTTANAVDWFWIGTWSSGSVFYFRLGNVSACCNNDLTISSFSTNYCPTNQWRHLSVSWKSAGTSKIYINGNLISSRSISSIPSTNPSSEGRIGLGHESGSTGSWNGEISKFNIYSNQLSDDAIYRNFIATRSRYGI
jgi:hypothetical protein